MLLTGNTMMIKGNDQKKRIIKNELAHMTVLVIFITSCRANMTVSNQDINVISTNTAAYPTITLPVVAATRTATRTIMRALDFQQRWLSNVPCAPPCWEGVTPGVTTSSQAEEILNDNSIFTLLETHVFDELTIGYIVFQYLWLDEAGTIIECGGDMIFDTETDNHIIMVIRNTFPPTKLSNLIANFGQPTPVNVIYDDLRNPNTWEVNIIWMSKGMQMHAGGFYPYTAIDENLELSRAEYFRPGLEGYSQGIGENWIESLVEWQGYADFNLYSISMWEVPTGSLP
jgi:hypothetical protein